MSCIKNTKEQKRARKVEREAEKVQVMTEKAMTKLIKKYLM